MKLETRVLDQAIEWLIPKIGTSNETITNLHNEEPVDAVQALCVWCLRLRYNLIDHDYDGIENKDYPAWNGYRYLSSSNLYVTVREMARLYRIHGGITPDYSGRNHKDISKWTYKRIFGPDVFVPIFFNVEDLWQATQKMFPDLVNSCDIVKETNTVDRIDSNFLTFEMYNNELANVLSAM